MAVSQQDVPYYRWSWPYQFCLLELRPRRAKANERVEHECKEKQGGLHTKGACEEESLDCSRVDKEDRWASNPLFPFEVDI